MSNKKTYCEWCGIETTREKTLANSLPILEFIEEKIQNLGKDKVWSDLYQGKKNDFSQTLLLYDGLMNSLKKRRICSLCMEQNHKLEIKYYSFDEQEQESEF